MTETVTKTPPRPIAPGDIVAGYSAPLSEWTAAQITGLDAESATAAVLELDWSGPEPDSVEELGEVRPLCLTHGNWGGALSHTNYQWVLPRSFKVVGSLPLLHDQVSPSYGGEWGLGLQLFLQRRWDQGQRDPWSDPHTMVCAADELDALLQDSAEPDPEIRGLMVRDLANLDVDRLVARFPGLTELRLYGRPGMLSHASGLNRLTFLKSLSIVELFGMDASDCLLPSRVPALESLDLYSVPADYAAAIRAAWKPEVASGVYVTIAKPREAGWLTEHQDDPFRSWDGDDFVPRAAYEAAVAQYEETRQAVMTALAEAAVAGDVSGAADGDRASRLFEIGARYGEAFNDLDEQHGFIDTIERERLFEVLDQIVDAAEAECGTELAWARESLVEGTESVRDW